MSWQLLIGRVFAQSDEATGRALLPNLENLFLAPCFRDVEKLTGEMLGQAQEARQSVQTCLVTSTTFYGYLLMGVAAIVCFAYIIRAGYIMFTAFGDESKYATGKKTMLYAVIGFAISMLAYFIIRFFTSLLGYTGSY